MKKYILLISLLVLVGSILIKPARSFHKYYMTDCAANGLEQQTEYDMYLETISPEQYRAMLAPYQESFVITTTTEILYNDTLFPIYQIDSISTTSDRQLLVFATTHGNEFATALVIPEFLSYLEQHPELRANWNIRMISPINPVGLAYGSRYTEDGCDINRDFKDFRTVGAQVQRDAILATKPDLIVSLHEGPHEDFYFFTNESVGKPLTRALLTSLKDDGVTLAKTMSGSPIPLFPAGVATENIFSKTFKHVFDVHMIGSYSDTLGIGVITPESSWKETDVTKRITPHLQLLEAIVTSDI